MVVSLEADSGAQDQKTISDRDALSKGVKPKMPTLRKMDMKTVNMVSRLQVAVDSIIVHRSRQFNAACAQRS